MKFRVVIGKGPSLSSLQEMVVSQVTAAHSTGT